MRHIIALALAVVALPTSAQAAITINIDQVGSSVMLTGLGSFNTSGLSTYSTNAQGGAFINAASGVVSIGASAPITIFSGLSGPVLGYLQSIKYASTATGDSFGVSQYLSAVYLPSNYQSNALLSGTSTYLGSTIASLGLKTGQYVFRSPSDTLTLNIGSAAVPEPATWAMMIFGMGAVGFAMRRRSKTKTTVGFA